MLRLSRSLRVSATQDTDKPGIQPVSKPESLHSCVISCVRVGQAGVDYNIVGLPVELCCEVKLQIVFCALVCVCRKS